MLKFLSLWKLFDVTKYRNCATGYIVSEVSIGGEPGVDWGWSLRSVRWWTSTTRGLERIKYPSEVEAEFSLKLWRKRNCQGWTSSEPDWLPEGGWQPPLWEKCSLEGRRSWEVVGEDMGPAKEGSGMVPAICLALLGLVLLLADRELVRGAHKQRQSSPACPQGHCLFMCRKKR